MRNKLSNAIRRFRRPGLSGSGWAARSIPLNSASITVSDYATIASQTATELRFSRPITDANGFQNSAPGARVSFTTNSRNLRLTVRWNGLVTRNDSQGSVNTYYSVGAVVVDGTRIGTFRSSNTYDTVSTQQFEFTMAAGTKTVVIYWPYWTGMTLTGLEIEQTATLGTVSRPASKLAVCGDSITHGALATSGDALWAVTLAGLENLQLVNFANGGAVAVAADATTALTSGGATGATKVTYMIGYNNFVAQTPTATFQTAVQGWITNARAALPAAAIHVISPIYSPNTNTITLAQYRSAVQAAELAVGDANTFYIDGLSIMTNNTNRLVDGIHPNATGAAEIATNLAALI